MDPSSSVRPPLFPEEIEKINQHIESKISRAEKWKEIAGTVALIALSVIAVAAVCTLIFYTLPLAPIAFTVIVIPLVLVGIALLGGPSAGPEAEALWAEGLKISLFAGINLGKMIYTVKIAMIVGAANLAVLAVTAPVAAGGGAVYLWKHHEVSYYKDFKKEFEKYVDDQNYELPKKMTKELDSLLRKLDEENHELYERIIDESSFPSLRAMNEMS